MDDVSPYPLIGNVVAVDRFDSTVEVTISVAHQPKSQAIEKIESLIDIMRQGTGRVFLSPVVLGKPKCPHRHHGGQA